MEIFDVGDVQLLVQHCIQQNVRFEDRQKRFDLIDINFDTTDLCKYSI